MKNPGISGNNRRRWGTVLLVSILAMLLVFSIGTLASAASGGEGDAEAHGPGWVKTDTFRVLHFIVLFGGLFFLLRKPVSSALNARVQDIEDQLSDLEAKKAAAEKQLAEYNQKFAQLEQEAEGIMAEYVRQGEEAKTRILKEAEATAEKLKIQAQKTIESEFQSARNELRAEVLDRSLAKAEEIIKSQISVEDQEKLVDEYLAKVVVS